VPEVDLDAVESGLEAWWRRPGVVDDPVDVVFRGPRSRVPIGLKPLDGARDGDPFERELATGPA